MNNFYALTPVDGMIFGTKWAYAERLKPAPLGDFALCSVCGRPISGRQLLPPIRLKLSSSQPEKWGDFLFGAGLDILVSDRFKAKYEQEGLTGITKFHVPAEIVAVGNMKIAELTGNLAPTYHAIEILWGGAVLDVQASGLVYKYPEEDRCHYCKQGVKSRWDRIIFENGSWTGADIFTPRGGPVPEIVSERFKEVVKKYNMTGFRLVPSEKYAYDESRKLPDSSWYVRD